MIKSINRTALTYHTDHAHGQRSSVIMDADKASFASLNSNGFAEVLRVTQKGRYIYTSHFYRQHSSLHGCRELVYELEEIRSLFLPSQSFDMEHICLADAEKPSVPKNQAPVSARNVHRTCHIVPGVLI